MEVAPPASVWETISASLNEEDEKVVPHKKKEQLMFFRYAAAAIFIGIVAFGVIKWNGTLNKSPEKNSTNAASLIKDTGNINESNMAAEPRKESGSNSSAETPDNNVAIIKTGTTGESAYKKCLPYQHDC